MKKIKKLIVIALATAMLLGMTLTAHAAHTGWGANFGKSTTLNIVAITVIIVAYC